MTAIDLRLFGSFNNEEKLNLQNANTKKEHAQMETGDWHDQVKSASRLLALAMDRLGLEERHEHLSRSSPLYKKVSLAVVPPLKATLNYIHGQIDPEHANPEALGKESGQYLEDEDVASPVNDHHGLTSLLSMLATALACAGATSFKAIGSILHDRITDEDEEGETEEPQSMDDRDENKNLPTPRDFSEEQESKISLKNVLMIRTSTSGLMTQATVQSLRKAPTLTTLTSGRSDETRVMYSSEIMAKALSNGEYRPPPENLRTTWENSVMANHHKEIPADQVLIKYASNQDELSTDTAERREILKYHIALKLKETFDFDDENYLYDHFDVWLVKDVLLQGHMYITRDAVCFYSLLPGKFSETELNDPELTLHSGTLGHKLAHYGDAYFSSVYTNQFWAVLKPQTLSIYTSPSKTYFPVRTIDLRNALSCEISDPSVSQSSPLATPNLSLPPTETLMSQLNSEMSSIVDGDVHESVQAGVWFKINCTDKTYRFHTSSIYSARHWYNSISKAVFQLHNTNHQREVLLRLPVEDIVDYKRNLVLTENEELDLPDSQDDETPIFFSIKFNLPGNVDDSKIQKFKARARKASGLRMIHDSAHFVVFHEGHKLSSTFEEALGENVIDSLSRNQTLRKKAKKFFREDRTESLTLSLKKPPKVVNTVQPDFSSSQSVIDKIVHLNNKILQARDKELSRLADEQSTDSVDRGTEDEAKKKSVSNFKIMKDKLLPRPNPSGGKSGRAAAADDSTSVTFYREDESLDHPQDFEIPELDHHLQLPKPFSLQMLKNLDIHMVRKRRTFEDIAGQYGNLVEVTKAKRAKENAFQVPRPEENEANLKREAIEAQIQLQESSKRGKLRSITSLLKSVSNITAVWTLKPEHYDRVINHDKYYVGNNRVKSRALNNFRKHFSLGPDSHLVSTYHAHLKRTFPVFGRLYVGKEQLCFRSKVPGVSTKMVLPLRNIQSCKKQSRQHRHPGLLFNIRGLEDLQVAFSSKEARDDCQKMVLKLLRKEDVFNPDSEFMQNDDLGSSIDVDETDKHNKRSDEMALLRVQGARLRLLEDKISYATGIDMPLVLEDNPFTTTEVRLAKSYKITLLTIGSRGDVQPYIALGKALLKEGHEVTIATHQEFEEWIMKYGIRFKSVAGNPAELMQLMVTHGFISVGFLKEASSKFRGWIGELLESSWKACQGAELLIESPSAMAGLHIAEALNIPYMRAFTMPWTRTRAYPHAFLVPDQNRGGSYNFLTHVMFENVFWKGISGQVNRWRLEMLGLPRTTLVKMQQSRVPFLYNVSPALFPPSVDFPDWVKVTGYWFLDEGSDEYEPPKELVKFLEEAKTKGEKIVYIGFGSIVVSDAKALTRTIVEAVVDLGVKCILNKGWSDKLSKSKDDPEIELPSQVCDAGMIPHDWLFTRIDAAVHHGGSGTTGATLRAGLPTIVKPFFGDQFFFAARVEDLGVGLSLKRLNKKSFTKALQAITSEEKYLTKAVEIARAMSHERGVMSAVEAIYSELAYSKSLILVIRHESEQRKQSEDNSGAQTPVLDEALDMVKKLKGDDNNDNDNDDSGEEESDDDDDSSNEETADNSEEYERSKHND